MQSADSAETAIYRWAVVRHKEVLPKLEENVMTDAIMVLNMGSSSIKFGLYEATAVEPTLLLSAKITRINQTPLLQARWAEQGLKESQDRSGKNVEYELSGSGMESALDALLSWLHKEASEFHIIGAGHRIVHGGPNYSAPVHVTEEVLNGIACASPAAPHHNPVNILGIRRIQQHHPKLPQIACFDTHFHCTQPAVESRYALPRRFTDLGIRRYGFHGLSYEYVSAQLSQLDSRAASGRTLVAHLGNGASLCALRDGRSYATTMGFTVLEGLMMGQRCGNLDPGVVLYLQQELGHSANEVMNILYKQSGLLGVSGITNDMRELLASKTPAAEEAIDLYCHRAVREAGALIALLQGLDALVFTGGMGEKAAAVRQRIAEGLSWLGLQLDSQANDGNALCISTESSAVSVWVIPTDEEFMIAHHTHRLLLSTESF